MFWFIKHFGPFCIITIHWEPFSWCSVIVIWWIRPWFWMSVCSTLHFCMFLWWWGWSWVSLLVLYWCLWPCLGMPSWRYWTWKWPGMSIIPWGSWPSLTPLWSFSMVWSRLVSWSGSWSWLGFILSSSFRWQATISSLFFCMTFYMGSHISQESSKI